MNKKIIGQIFSEALESIKHSKCPTCKNEIVMSDFKDDLSIKEYGISGMCQACQDGFFN